MSSDEDRQQDEKRLKALRSEIDALDDKLIKEVVNRLVDRIPLIKEIGEIKNRNHTNIRDDGRRREVISNWKSGASRGVSSELMGEIAEAIIEEAERIEKRA